MRIYEYSPTYERLADLKTRGGKTVPVRLYHKVAFGADGTAGSSRTLYQGSIDGWLPRYLSHVNHNGAPTAAMWTDLGFNLILLSIASTDVGAYYFILAVSNCGYIIFNFLNLNAGWIHRIDSGHIKRPYRAPTIILAAGTVLAADVDSGAAVQVYATSIDEAKAKAVGATVSLVGVTLMKVEAYTEGATLEVLIAVLGSEYDVPRERLERESGVGIGRRPRPGLVALGQHGLEPIEAELTRPERGRQHEHASVELELERPVASRADAPVLRELDTLTFGGHGLRATAHAGLQGLDELARRPPGGSLDNVRDSLRKAFEGESPLPDTLRVPRFPYCAPLSGEARCNTPKFISFPQAVFKLNRDLATAIEAAKARMAQDTVLLRRWAADTLVLKARLDSINRALQTATAAQRNRLKARRDSVQSEVDTLRARSVRLREELETGKETLEVGLEAAKLDDTRVDAAYALERLIHPLLKLSNTLQCRSISVPSDSILVVTVTVSHKDAATIERLPGLHDTVRVTFEAEPKRTFRVALGLALLYANKATYPTFSTSAIPDAGDSVLVVRTGDEDRRINYGLSLGLSYWKLNPPDKRWAVWLPELTINPLDEIRSVGIGVGVSYSVVKLGVGLIWTRHELASSDTPEGSRLANADAFKTESTFGKGKVYVSISLIGLPPFVRSGS